MERERLVGKANKVEEEQRRHDLNSEQVVEEQRREKEANAEKQARLARCPIV